MAAPQILTRFDFSTLPWKLLYDHGDNRIGTARRLSGVELVQEVWNRLHTGYQTLFLGVEVTFSQPLRRDDLVEAAKSAWQQLRYLHPLIATNIDFDQSGAAQISYHSASQLDVDKWVERTLLTNHEDCVDLEAVRTRVASMKIPNSAGDQTFLHFLSIDAAAPEEVTTAGFLFHTHHTPFDGVGIQTTASMYIDLLTTTITNGTTPLEWGTEISNLLPPALDILMPDEPLPVAADSQEIPTLDNPAYIAAAVLFQENQKVSMNPWGFKPFAINNMPPKPQYEVITLSKEETAQVLTCVKNLQPGKYTYTHLAHAALCMVTIDANPPPAEAASAWMGCWGLKNARARLEDPYAKHYPGYALSATQMSTSVSLFLAEDGTVLPLDTNTLRRVLDDVKMSYQTRDESRAIIGHMSIVCEIFAAVMTAGFAANMIPPNNGFSFSSDGIGERYIPRNRRTPSGTTVLEISKVFTSLNNVEPGPFFRTASWNDQINLSADFNAAYTSKDNVLHYLQKWKEYILMVTTI
ncbi:hypothetical protein BT96DRAFT_981838 [Gymnopus androsaceus JB14]|uniref:CoA-dependent acyltransferase n=1 Tax=Gymnopus androsaceus JB14 TaxID=1447944 RepID=A0A6A4GKU2_9AGAR|nr:hypothetical protein BT96DRAFT_981838 [Gymnopus androsaceus JB14]